MNKKGDLSIQFIVMAALALIVLIIIAVYFMGGMKTLLGGQAETIQLTEQRKSVWKTQCNMFCSLGQADGFCDQAFQYDSDKDGQTDEVWVCDENKFLKDKNLLPSDADIKDLEVGCNTIVKKGDRCEVIKAGGTEE